MVYMMEIKVTHHTAKVVGRADPTEVVTYHLSNGSTVVETWGVYMLGKEILAKSWEHLEASPCLQAQAVVSYVNRAWDEMEQDDEPEPYGGRMRF
jgi:hypothetical protein